MHLDFGLLRVLCRLSVRRVLLFVCLFGVVVSNLPVEQRHVENGLCNLSATSNGYSFT